MVNLNLHKSFEEIVTATVKRSFAVVKILSSATSCNGMTLSSTRRQRRQDSVSLKTTVQFEVAIGYGALESVQANLELVSVVDGSVISPVTALVTPAPTSLPTNAPTYFLMSTSTGLPEAPGPDSNNGKSTALIAGLVVLVVVLILVAGATIAVVLRKRRRSGGNSLKAGIRFEPAVAPVKTVEGECLETSIGSGVDEVWDQVDFAIDVQDSTVRMKSVRRGNPLFATISGEDHAGVSLLTDCDKTKVGAELQTNVSVPDRTDGTAIAATESEALGTQASSDVSTQVSDPDSELITTPAASTGLEHLPTGQPLGLGSTLEADDNDSPDEPDLTDYIVTVEEKWAGMPVFPTYGRARFHRQNKTDELELDAAAIEEDELGDYMETGSEPTLKTNTLRSAAEVDERVELDAYPEIDDADEYLETNGADWNSIRTQWGEKEMFFDQTTRTARLKSVKRGNPLYKSLREKPGADVDVGYADGPGTTDTSNAAPLSLPGVPTPVPPDRRESMASTASAIEPPHWQEDNFELEDQFFNRICPTRSMRASKKATTGVSDEPNSGAAVAEKCADGALLATSQAASPPKDIAPVTIRRAAWPPSKPAEEAAADRRAARVDSIRSAVAAAGVRRSTDDDDCEAVPSGGFTDILHQFGGWVEDDIEAPADAGYTDVMPDDGPARYVDGIGIDMFY